jgi:hypothetical protein
MLEAENADLVFTISLKRSTQNSHLSTSCPADYPIFWIAIQTRLGVRPRAGDDPTRTFPWLSVAVTMQARLVDWCPPIRASLWLPFAREFLCLGDLLGRHFGGNRIAVKR